MKDEIHIMQVVFIIKNDEFDEPLIEPVDAQGTTEEEAAKMSVDIFFGSVWHPLDQSMTKKNPVHISVDYLRQHYDFDMYCQSVVRIGVKDERAHNAREFHQGRYRRSTSVQRSTIG